MSASIAHWLEHLPSNPAVVRLSPGRGGTYSAYHAEVKSISWQIKAMPGTSQAFDISNYVAKTKTLISCAVTAS